MPNLPYQHFLSSQSLYQNRSKIKWIILVVSIGIAAVSVFYTNNIVDKLKERERKLIELYAKSVESTANTRNFESVAFQALVIPNRDIPVILTDALKNPIDYANLDLDENIEMEEKFRLLRGIIREMEDVYEPITINIQDEEGRVIDKNYVYYRNSYLLNQLRFFPLVQLSIIGIFGILVYVMFSYSRSAEQNRVWVGLAKETAHQLGTPLSSLMAWMEFLKTDEKSDKTLVIELQKDIDRLETITARFSSIGSVPLKTIENIPKLIRSNINYLQPRLSKKVKISIDAFPDDLIASVNKPLFDWVIENLIKNAVDAMQGEGEINLILRRGPQGDMLLDVSDTGKGIPKGKFSQVFNPGYTTKSRGWGLGLTLVKRIIENYHKGKIFVKHSEPGKGTTFRIMLSTAS